MPAPIQDDEERSGLCQNSKVKLCAECHGFKFSDGSQESGSAMRPIKGITHWRRNFNSLNVAQEKPHDLVFATARLEELLHS